MELRFAVKSRSAGLATAPKEEHRQQQCGSAVRHRTLTASVGHCWRPFLGAPRRSVVCQRAVSRRLSVLLPPSLSRLSPAAATLQSSSIGRQQASTWAPPRRSRVAHIFTRSSWVPGLAVRRGVHRAVQATGMWRGTPGGCFAPRLYRGKPWTCRRAEGTVADRR